MAGLPYAALCVLVVVSVQFLVVWVAKRAPAPSRARLSLDRRAQHAASGVAIVGLALAAGTGRAYDSAVLLGSAGLLYAGHVLRLRSPRVAAWVRQRFGTLLREHELNGSPPGAFYFLLGCGLVTLACDKRDAVAAVLCLSFGDPCAGIAGSLWGRAGGKSAAGTAACVAASFAATAAFGALRGDGGVAWAAVAAAAAGASEAAGSPGGLDDNLLVPCGVGAALRLYEALGGR